MRIENFPINGISSTYIHIHVNISSFQFTFLLTFHIFTQLSQKFAIRPNMKSKRTKERNNKPFEMGLSLKMFQKLCEIFAKSKLTPFFYPNIHTHTHSFSLCISVSEFPSLLYLFPYLLIRLTVHLYYLDALLQLLIYCFVHSFIVVAVAFVFF